MLKEPDVYYFLSSSSTEISLSIKSYYDFGRELLYGNEFIIDIEYTQLPQLFLTTRVSNGKISFPLLETILLQQGLNKQV